MEKKLIEGENLYNLQIKLNNIYGESGAGYYTMKIINFLEDNLGEYNEGEIFPLLEKYEGSKCKNLKMFLKKHF